MVSFAQATFPFHSGKFCQSTLSLLKKADQGLFFGKCIEVTSKNIVYGYFMMHSSKIPVCKE